MVELKDLSNEIERFRGLFEGSSKSVDIPTFISRAFTGDSVERELVLGTLNQAGLKILASADGLKLLKSIFLNPPKV